MKRIAVIILGLIVGLIAFLAVRTIVYPWRRQIEAGTAACSFRFARLARTLLTDCPANGNRKPMAVWMVSQRRSLEVYGDECSVTNNICADSAFRQSERKRAAQRSSRHRKRANTSTRHSGQCCGALTRAFPERSGHSNQTCAGIRRKSNCSLIDRIHGISSD